MRKRWVNVEVRRRTPAAGPLVVFVLMLAMLPAPAAPAGPPAVPADIGVLVEQLPHVTSVMISTRFAEVGVQASVGEVWYDGTNYVVDVDFQSTGGGPGDEGWQVWTTLGIPEVGSHQVSIRHTGTGQILVSQLFQTLAVGSLAAGSGVTLEMFQMLGDYEFDPVGPEVYPHLRAVIPATSGLMPLATPSPQPVPQPVPGPLPRPIGNCPDYPLRWRFVVTNGQTGGLTGLSLALSAPSSVSLEPSSFQASSLPAGGSLAFELEVGASGSPGMRTIGYDLDFTGAGGAQGSLAGTFRVAVLAGTCSASAGQDQARVWGSTPVAVRPNNYTYDWTFSDFQWAGEIGVLLPTEDHYTFNNLNIPPEELAGNVGVPTVIVGSIGGAAIGGLGKAAYDLIAEGETSVRNVLAGAAAGAIAGDLGPALKAGQAIIKGIKAVGGFFKSLFSGPESLRYSPDFVFEDLYFPEGQIDATLLDGSHEIYKFIGRGDPVPGSPLGSNVNLTSSLVPTHFASCAAGPDLRLSEAEVTAAAWSWARGEDRSGCGVPGEEALLDAIEAWAAGSRATALGTARRGPAGVRPRVASRLQAAAASAAPGGTLVIRQSIAVPEAARGIVVELALPESWKVAPLDRVGAFFQRFGQRFLWLELPAGERELVYKLGVPDTAAQGEVEIGARVASVAGSLLEVEPVRVRIEGSAPSISLRR